MNYFKKCCVSSCLNATGLTKNPVVYFRFPINANVKQNWLNAINWSEGKPKYNDYVCSEHFETKDLPTINEYTTIVPTIFNSELVFIKQESHLFDANGLTRSEDVIDAEHLKIEIDSSNENDDCDVTHYEIVDPLTLNCEYKIIQPEKKRIKLDDDSNSNPTACAPETETILKERHMWEVDDTREFLLCITKHREEFLRTRSHKFEKIELYLKQLDVLSQPATEEQLYNKWKALMKRYKSLPTLTVNEIKFPFIKEMKTILLDVIEPDQHSISIGLDSSFQAIKRNDTNLLALDDTWNYKKTTKDVLLKKIESREMKNKILRKLLNDSYSNGFSVA